MNGFKEGFLAKFDRWLLLSNDPRVVPPLRIAFACLLLVNVVTWWLYADRWFTDDGLLTSETAQRLGNHANWSLLYWLPSNSQVVHGCLATQCLQVMLLMCGVWSRLNMACIFVWLVSFQNRNPLICDGEDTLFRMFAFMMIWLPLDCGWSITRWWSSRVGQDVVTPTSRACWALTIMQAQTTLIYLSATWNKLGGQTWRDGTAMYYVSFMTDLFGRIPGSDYWFDHAWFVYFTTYSALLIEAVLPLALWIPKLRLWAIGLGIMLHLGIEVTMHLFLFEWIMILGLCTFLGRKRDAGNSFVVPFFNTECTEVNTEKAEG